jgi:hypothetical protein
VLYLRCLDLGNCLEYPPCRCLDLKSAWKLVSVIFRSSAVGKPWGLLGVPSLVERSCFTAAWAQRKRVTKLVIHCLIRALWKFQGRYVLLTFALER